MDKFDKIIREIKIARQPECWLYNIFINSIKYDNDTYIRYTINGKMLFEYYYKIDLFYYSYDIIYTKLKENYNCDKLKIKELVKSLVYKNLQTNINVICTNE